MVMITPADLEKKIPLDWTPRRYVEKGRRETLSVLAGRDPRLLVLVGPCSLHDRDAALEYADRLARLSERVSERLLIVMRAYPEKSRTALGWRGLAEDPDLSGEQNPEKGIGCARELLVELAALGMPLGAEIVSPYLWRYWEDCLSWAAIGARGVGSQALRELGSVLPFPLAFKNALDGSLDSAVNAALVSSKRRSLPSIDAGGRIALVAGSGNPLPHLCLRGGSDGQPKPNWEVLPRAAELMESAGLAPSLLIDAGHDNATAAPPRDLLIEILSRKRRSLPGWDSLRGFMLESFLHPGRQEPGPRENLLRGVSITDSCLGWEETEKLLLEVAEGSS